jgi:dihydrofolate reductase
VRKIVVYELLSLDGVAEDPDAFFTDWDDAMDANLAAVVATQDAFILGRRSYTEWSQFWPSSEIQPFATFINGVTKYVATSTPLDRDWANATVLEGRLVECVRDLKQQRGGDIGVHASISVAQSLLAADVGRRAQARDSAEDRRPRTTTPRRLAIDSARIDPKRDVTDRLSARRLSRDS